ncbi:MAG: nucleoid occlusion factor SlmA [Gammaproteobacteria bacterium]|jgi:TetR/AcrR family transcriptional regulator|nr:nucleoid occlusion factor SlmA [Gammaproteobacteria bacterium]MBT3866897.1 nucleoid occlusion factor SlmA [Gammaproteobacteria bacterium]MBT5441868.1 nucleoid occlusion factor SlmA [Gammaproteobacteria bacterium]MBT5791265.1 nucleoid occlusion factor SlmA [Gammaproteobacteria bacterium]MBT6950796.1 nucleoid occlusion factor SlmA [Gammaproteobacteria bacterium]
MSTEQTVTNEVQKKPSRKEQILQSLATILEQSPGGRITTAGLAKHVGVSEAALYRHFPSKAKMFEALIEFIENTIFPRISQIMNEEVDADKRCEKILGLILTFCERNPGITRILTGDPLAGETERLRQRVTQLFDRIEAQLRQIIREMPIRGQQKTSTDPVVAANLLLSLAEGRIGQYVRSDFERKPTTEWDAQWQVVREGLF